MERLGRAKPLILVLAGGVLYGAAAPGNPLPGAVFLFMVPALAGLAGLTPRSAAIVGALQWSLAFALVFRWLPGALALTFNLPAAAAWPVAIALVVTLYGPFGALAGAAAALTAGRAQSWLYGGGGSFITGPVALAIGFPLFFGFAEWLRGAVVPVLGIAVTASSLVPIPALLAALPWVGEVGLAVMVMTVNTGLYLFALAIHAMVRQAAPFNNGRLSASRRHSAAAGLGIVMVALTIVIALAAWLGQPAVHDGDAPPIVLVSVNADPAMKWREQYHGTITNLYLDRSSSHCGECAEIMAWPETALNYYPQLGGPHMERLRAFARRRGVVLLAGGPEFERIDGATRYYNSVFAITGERVSAVYRKERLFPFTEYCPVPLLVPLYRRVFGETQFTPFTGAGIVTIGGRRLGMAICFESTMPRLMARRANGADAVIVFSDDSWLGVGAGAGLHHASAVLRAIENRIWVFHAVNGGMSAIITPRGEALGRLAQAGGRGCISGCRTLRDIMPVR